MDQPELPLKPAILIAPLDWGLGHATRCIPIIHKLIQKNCHVLVAAGGKIKMLLQQEFPELAFIDLKGYRVRYSRNSWMLPLQIGRQIPKIISTIQYENERLKEIVKEHRVQGIISDNRYGFYHSGIPSVFITHQLRIKTAFGKIADDFIQRLNYKFIDRFVECWIPDNEKENQLAGALSHPGKKPAVPVKYIGPLSRFKEEEEGQDEQQVLVLLSGPEPQRTLFENLLVRQLKEYEGPVVFVRGLPGMAGDLDISPNVCVYQHLPTGALNKKMSAASVIISRCGYSTVMDLAVLRKKSILVPTPLQTEQEYLAGHLMKTNFALCIEQKKFSLKQALERAGQFNYQVQNFSAADSPDTALDDFIALVKASIQ